MAVVEICAYSASDAIAAAAAGADRIELCRAPESDGLTPTRTALEQARAISVPVHPIVRPRPSFVATGVDETHLCESLAHVRDLGYPGAVVGVLDTTGSEPDWPLLERIAGAAGDLALTFHRAFDHVADQDGALAGLAELGFARVLTSGRPGRAIDHLELLAELAESGRRRGVTVMAAGSIRSEHVPQMIASGITEVHASAGGSEGSMAIDEVSALVASAHSGDCSARD